MNNPAMFLEVGRVLINVNHIVAVEECIDSVLKDGKMEMAVCCTIYTVDGNDYFYNGRKTDFINEVNELYRKVGM